MTVARIAPGPVDGAVEAPPSKSYTHRLLLAAHLSGRTGRLVRPLVSADTLRTARALRALGSEVQLGPARWTVGSAPGRSSGRAATIRCGESGTTLRLLSAAAALRSHRVRFVGEGRLPRRPMRPLFAALRTLGARIDLGRPGHALPFELQGPIHGGELRLPVDESSQFTSALLFALPTVRPGSRIRAIGTPVSEPYVRASLEVIRRHGVSVSVTPDGFRIPGGQRFGPVDATVPGDASSAAYLWAAAALTGGSVSVRGIPPGWPQADLAILPLLRRYGATVTRRGEAISVRGGRRRPFRVVLTDAPDLYPLAGVLAAAAPGRSLLIGADHVVAKESNRRLETVRLVRSLGAKVTVAGGGLAIDGTDRPRRFRLGKALDHRLVMSASVGALAADGPSEVSDAAAVAKSFPAFFATLAAVGAKVTRR